MNCALSHSEGMSIVTFNPFIARLILRERAFSKKSCFLTFKKYLEKIKNYKLKIKKTKKKKKKKLKKKKQKTKK